MSLSLAGLYVMFTVLISHSYTLLSHVRTLPIVSPQAYCFHQVLRVLNEQVFKYFGFLTALNLSMLAFGL
jgi:hypothetical protein